MKKILDKDKKYQKYVKDLNEVRGKSDRQKEQAKGLKQQTQTDRKLYSDYKEQSAEAARTGDTEKLKNLNRTMLDLANQIKADARSINLIENEVERLSQEIKGQEQNLREYLKWIIKRERLDVEQNKIAPAIQKHFLGENETFIKNIHSVFDDLGLKRMDYLDLAFDVRCNYEYALHLSLINLDVTLPLDVHDSESHKKHYEKEIKRCERVIEGYGEVRQPKSKLEKPEEKKQGIMEKVKDVARKVTSTEYSEIFNGSDNI